MAENAFLTPGKHRLLTAAGLSVGLYGGRELMDVITARKALRDKPLEREETLQALRPLHGIMRYNRYSDSAGDRWKSVADSFAPMIFGAMGAYMGSRHYFYGGKAVKALGKGAKLTLEGADNAANMAQSDSVSKLASTSFAAGSPFGTHLFGAFFPLNNGMSSVRFQLAKRHPDAPFLKRFNRWLGNRGTSSHKLTESIGNTVKWLETAITEGKQLEPAGIKKAVKDITQIFGKVSPEQEVKLARYIEELAGTIHEATKHIKDPAERSKAVRKMLKEGIAVGENAEVMGLSGVPLERMLIHSGFKDALKDVRLGDNGPLTFFARLLGSGKGERAAEQAYRRHLVDAHPEHYGPELLEQASKVVIDRTKAGLAISAAGVMAGGAMMAGKQIEKDADRLQELKSKDGSVTRVDEAAEYYQASREKVGNALDWVNGAPLDTMHWLSRVVITPPSMHRLMNAAYFSGALIVGTKLGNVMAGRHLKSALSKSNPESLIAKKDVWAPLRPLHGLLAYTPGSRVDSDRIKQAAHFIMPVAVGMFGTFTGSHLFFRDRIKKLDEREYLEDYADKISMEQSKVYAGATAVTSIFNTGSGMHFLPVFNYSSNLHNRFMMAGGYQVAMPGLGKVWSGNPSLFPWGVSRTLDFTVKYAAHNPDEFPRLLPDLAHAVVAKLYPDLTDAELGAAERAFINRVYELRDPYLEHGQIPAPKMEKLEEELRTAFTKEGLEHTLELIGLDPAKANLASNGVSGTIANVAGAKGKLKELHNEYRDKYEARKTQRFTATPEPQLSAERRHEGTLNKVAEQLKERPKQFIERLRQAEAAEMEPQLAMK